MDKIKILLLGTLLVVISIGIFHDVKAEGPSAVSVANPNLAGPLGNQTAQNPPTFQNNAWQLKLNKQVQIVADITNNLDKAQPFAYIVQILDQNNAVISLSWISGSLDPIQSMSPSQSWIPTSSGNYTVQIYVWAGINNPQALSPPLTMKISVS